RTLKSKSTIISFAILVFGLAPFIPAITGNSGQFQGNLNASAVMLHDDAGYHFLVFVTNEFGQPLSGIHGQFVLKGQGHNYSNNGTSNATGYISITILAPQIRADYFGGGFIEGFNGNQKFIFNVPQLSPGEIYPLPVAAPFSSITDTSNASRRLLNAFYAAPYGAMPYAYSLYYSLPPNQNMSSGTGNSSSSLNPVLNESQMYFVGVLNNFHQAFRVIIPPDQICTNQDPPCTTQLNLALFSINGSLIYSTQMDESSLYPPAAPPIRGNDLASQYFVGFLSYFVPVIAIVGSFSAYGRDRVSGILESVLSRPVTRRGLALSRFFSTFLALGVTVLGAIILIDFILRFFTGSFLDPMLVLGTALSFLVELAAFIGVMFLISHLVKSSISLILVGIALVIALDFLPSIIGALGATAGSLSFIQDTILLDFANPAQFTSLMNVMLTNQVLSLSVSIDPSIFGVTIASMLVAGLVWSIVPLAIYLQLATRRD
ncbi:MAG: ABC transporter permease, partial [Nitrososphaerales archaeon]